MFDKRKDSNQEGSNPAYESGVREQKAAAPASSGRAAVIGPRIRINGDVSGDEDLVIEGSVEGKVSLGDHRVDIGPSGQVKADIEAKVVKIDGVVEGDVNAGEKVIISRSGNVRGNIVAPRMTLEDGAKFKGSIDMDPGESAAPRREAPRKVEDKPESKPSSNVHGLSSDKKQAEGLALKAE